MQICAEYETVALKALYESFCYYYIAYASIKRCLLTSPEEMLQD